MQDIRLVIGLGNPGADYVSTRHNAGFWLVDELARRFGGSFKAEKKFHGEVARVEIAGKDIRLLKPMTFMNRSGQSARAACDFLKLPPENILVAHDEIDLPPGTLRLKKGGGHGGNNGLRDVIAHLGPDFLRLRIGVGHPGNASQVVNYVLSRPTKDEEPVLLRAIDDAVDGIELLLKEGLQKAQTKLHSRET
ncbi:MAG TPA: aminoacyl-tRNA hydrolase [Gammaproteobacteria bacterium]|nr:aminoacyl-tRNA hydrolase [Gammaproteobacteria bacterium]